MVATDLLLQGVSSPRAAQIVNILAEEAHVVAAWLCPRMRGVTGQGKYFRWELDWYETCPRSYREQGGVHRCLCIVSCQDHVCEVQLKTACTSRPADT